jgi:cytochrome d ubiquinol oxidase subunit II
MLQGIDVDGRRYAGGWWDWLTPFSLLTGVSVVVGFALLGGCWLIWKTDGPLQAFAYRCSRLLGAALIGCIAAVSLATPLLDEAYYERWFAWPNVLFTAQVPLLVIVTSVAFFRAIVRRRELAPFLLALALFLLTFIGLTISIYPYVVPGRVTIWDAAAPDASLEFMLVGAAVLLPVILVYTGYAYSVFHGKVGTDGYH